MPMPRISGARSYGNISAYAFQTLNPLSGDGSQPIVMPVANYDWVSEPDKIGGRLCLNGTCSIQSAATARKCAACRAAQWESAVQRADRRPLRFRCDCRASRRLSVADDEQVGDRRVRINGAVAGRYRHRKRVGRPGLSAGALSGAIPGSADDRESEVIEPMAAFVAAPNGGNPAQSRTRIARAMNSTRPACSAPIDCPVTTSSTAASASITACTPALQRYLWQLQYARGSELSPGEIEPLPDRLRTRNSRSPTWSAGLSFRRPTCSICSTACVSTIATWRCGGRKPVSAEGAQFEIWRLAHLGFSHPRPHAAPDRHAGERHNHRAASPDTGR